MDSRTENMVDQLILRQAMIRRINPTAIVLGSEAKGLKQRWFSGSETPIDGIRIPMAGKADSLNIAASAAIIAFEAARQRSNA